MVGVVPLEVDNAIEVVVVMERAVGVVPVEVTISETDEREDESKVNDQQLDPGTGLVKNLWPNPTIYIVRYDCTHLIVETKWNAPVIIICDAKVTPVGRDGGRGLHLP